MTRLRFPALLLLAALATGCVSHEVQYSLASEDWLLAERAEPGGRTTRYQIHLNTAGGDAVLRVTDEVPRNGASLGCEVREIDAELAEQLAVPAYTAVQVLKVARQSAASEAGIRKGDLLLRLDGAPLRYGGQLAEFESRLAADREVPVALRRGTEELELVVRAKVRIARMREEREVPLEAAVAGRAYAGVTLQGIPSEWAQRIWDAPHSAVVVTNVEVGSPAWVAGIRSGDLIEQVDGAPTPPVRDLVREIQKRGEQEQSIRFAVTRGDGDHYEADVALCDYRGTTKFWFPLVFWTERSAYQRHWTAGPLGILCGNRNHYVPDNRSRRPETRNVFHALLGLIHVETGPAETRIRLLWLISFET